MRNINLRKVLIRNFLKEGEELMEDLSKSIEIIKDIKYIGKLMKKSIGNQFKDNNLTGPQGMLLGILAHFGKMKISDLSEKLNLSNSTVSGILDRLEKQNFVERSRSDEDRRVVYVSVTDEYKKIACQRFKEIEQSIENKMKNANPEELDKILEGLEILKRKLE